MENQNTCDLCGIEEKLYYCQCEKYFCRYHRHFILHQCPKIYSISYLHNHIINGNRCYVCTKKYQQYLNLLEYLNVIVKDNFVVSIDILIIIVVLLILNLMKKKN